jgi:hypothetical protein
MRRSILGMLLLMFVFTALSAVMGGRMPMGGEGEKPSGPSPMRCMMCPMMGSDMEQTSS